MAFRSPPDNHLHRVRAHCAEKTPSARAAREIVQRLRTLLREAKTSRSVLLWRATCDKQETPLRNIAEPLRISNPRYPRNSNRLLCLLLRVPYTKATPQCIRGSRCSADDVGVQRARPRQCGHRFQISPCELHV